MKISVAIATYNRRHLLSRTLPTVFAQNLPSNQYEVLVVVDGSSDGTADFLRNLKAPCAFRVIEQPHRGLAAARNSGLNAARGELVLFLDDDLLCSPGLLKEHLAAHEGNSPLVACGPVLLASESTPSLATEWNRDTVERFLRMLEEDLERRWPKDIKVDANASARRITLLE